MCDHGDFASAADQFSHLVSGQRGGSDVVCGGGRCGNVAFNSAVKRDDRDARIGSLLQQGNGGLAVECGKADSRRVVGKRRGQHVDLAIDHGFIVRAFKRDPHAEFCGGLIGTGFHSLPELVLKPF